MIYPCVNTEMLCKKSFKKESKLGNINFEYGKVYKITNFGRSYYKEQDQFEDMWYIISLYDNGNKFSITRKGIEHLYRKGILIDNK